MARTGFKGTPTTGNLSLDVKYVFISFLQEYYAQHEKYIWNKDLKLTKLVIADKNAVDLEIVTKRPAIICSRGTLSWSYANPTQKHIGSTFFEGTKFGKALDEEQNQTFTDLLSGSITIHILSKSGIQAEEIASDTFVALTAYKAELREKGIHKVAGLSFGEEQTLQSNATIEYASVPISVNFLMQKTLRRGGVSNNCNVYLNDVQVHENIHFKVEKNGAEIWFEQPPAIGDTVKITYVEAMTVQTRTKQNLYGTVDGKNYKFKVQNNSTSDFENILGYYSMLQAIEVYDKSPESDHGSPSGYLWMGAGSGIEVG